MYHHCPHPKQMASTHQEGRQTRRCNTWAIRHLHQDIPSSKSNHNSGNDHLNNTSDTTPTTASANRDIDHCIHHPRHLSTCPINSMSWHNLVARPDLPDDDEEDDSSVSDDDVNTISNHDQHHSGVQCLLNATGQAAELFPFLATKHRHFGGENKWVGVDQQRCPSAERMKKGEIGLAGSGQELQQMKWGLVRWCEGSL